METKLSTDVIDNFLKLLYFGREKDYYLKCINRAYRDFSRTLRDLPKEKEVWKKEQIGHLYNAILSMIDTNHTQSSFDIWHKETCNLLRNNLTKPLSIGQSQKWINMSLKYMLCFGDKEIRGISKNIQYYHIPIDNIIQNEFKIIYNIKPILGPWSAIKSYSKYLNYQNEIRKLPTGIPIALEFEMFNSARHG